MDGESCIKKAYESILGGDFDGAIGWFRQAIDLEPDNASFHYKCSVSCTRSGRWELALHHAKLASELDPGHAEYRFHLDVVDSRRLVSDAKLLLAAGPANASEALLFAQEARLLDPLNAEASLAAGQCYYVLNRLQDAKDCVMEACRLDPSFEEARILLRKLNRAIKPTNKPR